DHPVQDAGTAFAEFLIKFIALKDQQWHAILFGDHVLFHQISGRKQIACVLFIMVGNAQTDAAKPELSQLLKGTANDLVLIVFDGVTAHMVGQHLNLDQTVKVPTQLNISKVSVESGENDASDVSRDQHLVEILGM